MYRTWKAPAIYCTRCPCERQCGLFHQYFINITYRQPDTDLAGQSTSVDISPRVGSLNEEEVQRSGLVPDARYADETRHTNVFDEIMASAARMVSPSYVEPPLPKLPEGIPGHTRMKSRLQRADTTGEDTTTIRYDRPVWDNEDLRKTLFDDSDEEGFLDANPPSIFEDEDTSIETLLKATSFDKHTNPIIHDAKDLHVFADSEDDYSTLDLQQARTFSVESDHDDTVTKKRIYKGDAEFESSLDFP